MSLKVVRICMSCGTIILQVEGVHYKDEGYSIYWNCACG